MKFIFPFIFTFIFHMAGFAQTTIPALTTPVVDTAGLLNREQSEALNGALRSIYENNGPQIGVLTIPSLNELPIEDYSMQVAKAWKLGREDKDNGILLIVAINDRRVRIEVGQGVEGDLTDAYSRRIIDNQIVPYFKQGAYAEGIILGVRDILLRMDPPIQLEKYLSGEMASQLKPQTSSHDRIEIAIFIIFFIIFFILPLFGIGGRRRGPVFFPGGGGYSGGSSGWSGGGGGFSGGGASGSW